MPEFPIKGFLPPIALVMPSAQYTMSKFIAHYFTLSEFDPASQRLLPVVHANPIGALVAMNMREVVASLLAPSAPRWERLVILETDMLPPQDALIKHALHTEPIVGSVYYLHEAPHHMIAMRDHGNGPAWMSKAEQKQIEDEPGLHAVDMVGMGLTSIARAVFEQWPAELPIFRTSIMPAALHDPGTRGEVSHDYYFCLKARELQVPIFIDSSIVCDQLTIMPVGYRQHEEHQGFQPTFAGAPEADTVGDAAFLRA